MEKNKRLEETEKGNIKPKDTELEDIEFEEETNNIERLKQSDKERQKYRETDKQNTQRQKTKI